MGAQCCDLSQSRVNNNITFKWLNPVNNTQKKGFIQFKFTRDGVEDKNWLDANGNNGQTQIGGEAMPTSYTLQLDPTEWFPTNGKPKLTKIAWQVKVNGGTYVGSAYEFMIPPKIMLTVSQEGGVFSWNYSSSTASTDKYMFQDVEWQTAITDSTQCPTVWDDSGTGGFTGQKDYSSDTTGYRHFRARARCIKGEGEWIWIYKSNASAGKSSGVRGYVLNNNLSYQFDIPKKTALTRVEVWYAVAQPTAYDVIPAGTSFTRGDYIDVTEHTFDYKTVWSGNFNITINPDYAAWIRVDLINGGNTTQGEVVCVGGTPLSKPLITALTPDVQNQTVTITFTNQCSLPTSKVKIKCVAIGEGGKQIELGEVGGDQTSITVSYAGLNVDKTNFGLYARYSGAYFQSSQTTWQSVDITKPQAPTGLTVTKIGDGKVQVSWSGTWASANRLEISWSDETDAWNSNLEPETYEVDNTARSFIIAGLQKGKLYYFRIRAAQKLDDEVTTDVYGPYSDLASVDLTEAPGTPEVRVNGATEAKVPKGSPVTVSWIYVSEDGTEQAKATVYIVNASNTVLTKYEVSGASQSYTFTPTWSYGLVRYVRVSTTSESGRVSELSTRAKISIAAALSASVSSTSIVNGVLSEMPISVVATGAGNGGNTVIKIIRDGSLAATRPDGSHDDGFDGETIYARSFTGQFTAQNPLVINKEDLVGRLDDGCFYFLTLSISDGYGQEASDSLRFGVEWSHQPEVPTATITNRTDGLCVINVSQPSNYASGDFCQIYRLSKDKPELIIDGGSYATDYIDPYPASGGGYRVVNVTVNGDYAGESMPAWKDYSHTQTFEGLVIDFDGQRLTLPYNLSLKTSWKKDFQRTVYLNGSVQGDWNKAVTMDASIGTVTLSSDDERIGALMELAAYPGIAHIRTPDGSSYAADIQISQSGGYGAHMETFELSVQRVDPEGNEGMTLAEWNGGIAA